MSLHFRTEPRLTGVGQAQERYVTTLQDRAQTHRGRASSEYHMTVWGFLSQSDALNLVPRLIFAWGSICN